MTINDQLDLDAAEAAITAYQQHADLGFACCSAHRAANVAAALVAEVRRLRASETDGWTKAIAYNQRWNTADDALTEERLLTRRLRNELSRQGRAYQAEIQRLKTELANTTKTAVTA